MIIISFSIPKSGSTLVFNYQKDLLERAVLKERQSQSLCNATFQQELINMGYKV
ncbi:hypothetical protein Glo7428_1615 [Gloeocapsa sp. PCC 7428]|nr:hypothetical protein Glo7428_1615 [Gloeocapsa sp. PCC 7428]